MSLYGALFAGVSGLAAQSSAMGAISDNITNVNTIGYKGSKVNFQTLVTKQVSLTKYSAGGVQSKPRSGIDQQGLLQATSNATDVALSGQGFFVVNSNADPAAAGSGLFSYTRAGSFQVNKEGYMQNVSGFFVQGWPLSPTDGSVAATPSNLDVDGNTYMKAYKNADGTWHYVNQNIIDENEVKPLNLKTIGGTADQTTQVKMGANLPSSDDIYDASVASTTGLHQTSTLVYDSLGDTHSFDFNWMKTNANTWNVQTKEDILGLTTTVTATTDTPDTTANFTVAGGLTGASTSVLTTGGTTSCAFFADGTIAFATVADADLLPVGTVFAVTAAEDSANNATFMVETVSSATTVFTNNNTDSTAVITVNGGTESVTGDLDFTPGAGGGTITFPAAPSATMQTVGTIFQVSNAEDSANNGYYAVTAYAASVVTVTRCGYVQVQDDKYLTQRGIPTPSGAATSVLYNGDNVYAAQGRLDFTASSRADVTAMDGMYFDVTIGANTLRFEFTTDGTSNNSGDVLIDLSSASTDTGAEVATKVADALANPRNWITTYNGGTAMITAGATIPLFYADGSTVKMIQQTGAAAMEFDVSNLSTSLIQSQTRVWSAGPPPTDSATGQFTLDNIVETDNALEFNGDGTPQDINVTKLGFDWANGSQSMKGVSSDIDKRISLFMGNTSQADGMTQLGGGYQLAYLTQNGAKFGNFSGVSISSDGVVTALFDNGVRRPVFQIPVATFTNPNGMDSLTGNTWIETALSGSYTLRTAGEAGAGTVNSASLEASTVDIGEEFTTMIVTQRAYSAAAKIITTADEMLDELVRIKR